MAFVSSKFLPGLVFCLNCLKQRTHNVMAVPMSTQAATFSNGAHFNDLIPVTCVVKFSRLGLVSPPGVTLNACHKTSSNENIKYFHCNNIYCLLKGSLQQQQKFCFTPKKYLKDNKQHKSDTKY